MVDEWLVVYLPLTGNIAQTPQCSWLLDKVCCCWCCSLLTWEGGARGGGGRKDMMTMGIYTPFCVDTCLTDWSM
jgi:hypothetical protein